MHGSAMRFGPERCRWLAREHPDQGQSGDVFPAGTPWAVLVGASVAAGCFYAGGSLSGMAVLGALALTAAVHLIRGPVPARTSPPTIRTPPPLSFLPVMVMTVCLLILEHAQGLAGIAALVVSWTQFLGFSIGSCVSPQTGDG